jgi:hypothetical protein
MLEHPTKAVPRTMDKKNKPPLTILVTSPTDVQAERDILMDLVVPEVKDGIANAYNLILDAKTWKNVGHPLISPEGKQQERVETALNPSEFDIFIAILWTRLGTSEEGETDTRREIDLAYESLKTHGRPEIFLYFNQRPNTPATALQATRLAEMLKVKERFKKEGFIGEYEGEIGFERLVRRDLTNFIIRKRERDSAKQSSDEIDDRERRIKDLYKAIKEQPKKGDGKGLTPSEFGAISFKKGQILEELVEEIFKSIKGFSVKRNVTSRDKEYDLIITNRSDDPDWRDDGYFIVVECKNWEKTVGNNVYTVLNKKIEYLAGRCKLGFIIGTGILAKTLKTSQLRESKGPIVIVMIDRDDLKLLVEQPENRSQLLRSFIEKAIFT